MVDPDAPGSTPFVAAMSDQGLVVLWGDGNAALFDTQMGTRLATRSDFATLDDGGAPFAGSESLGALFPTATGFALAGTRTMDAEHAVFVQPLDALGQPTAPADVLRASTALGSGAGVFVRRDDGAIAHAHRESGEPYIRSFDGSEIAMEEGEWLPSLLRVGDDLWFATNRRSADFEESELVLGRIRDGAMTRHAIDPPPPGSADYTAALASGDGSTVLLAWTRSTGTPDVEGYDERILYRRVDLDGAEPAFGPVVTIPQDGSGLTGSTDPRNESVYVSALVHLGGNRFFVAWDEGWTRFRSFGRFIEL